MCVYRSRTLFKTEQYFIGFAISDMTGTRFFYVNINCIKTQIPKIFHYILLISIMIKIPTGLNYIYHPYIIYELRLYPF